MSLPTLVLLHAFPLSSQIYLAQRDGLDDMADVVTPDFRGFGLEPLGEEQPSLDVLADDVVRLLDDRGVERAMIGGTSMGGYVALAVLHRHADRVSGLVLANTKASADAPAARENRERIAALVESEGSVRVLHDELEPKLLGSTSRADRPAVVADIHALVSAARPEGVAWAQRAMAARLDSLELLAAARVPVLVVAGDEDALMTADDAQAMAAAAPDGRLVVLPGAGHLACMEVPDTFTSAVRAWVGDLA
ncbi:MAG TPA: alpha/beta hydrolase [Candidatus Limnocylindria bacterium]|nr:alpha/beta hydrolase [Candidatus Limnocylindria bacterium]